MPVWYEVRKYDVNVSPLNVVRETPQQVVIEYTNYNGQPKQRRQCKHTEFADLFPTELEAWAFLKKRHERKRDQAVQDRLRAEVNLDVIHKEISRLFEQES